MFARTWAWLALAALPPAWITRAGGWGPLDPGTVVLGLAWWPLECLGRLAALKLLLEAAGAPPLRAPWRALPAAIATELLLSLRVAIRAMLGWLPGLALLTALDLSLPWARFSCAAALALGLLPGLSYWFRRLLAPRLLLERELSAAQALELSAACLRGCAGRFLRRGLPWWALCLGLELAGLFLPESAAIWLEWPAFAAALLPLALPEPAALASPPAEG